MAAGARPGAVSVVEPGADHLPAPDRDAAVALLRSLGVEGEYLLSVGTIEPRKNLARLFAAYGAVRGTLPEPWPLVVVGPGGWGQPHGPREGVVFSGPVPAGTLAGLYAGARLLAYVPLEEGFGLPPVEAMRVGTPVLTSPLPSVGPATLVVDPEVVEQIADGIARLAVDESLRARLAAAGEAHAAGLTWKAAAAAHTALWRRLG
jgi:glycosyltransferase involved in cell wall biosynthesis